MKKVLIALLIIMGLQMAVNAETIKPSYNYIYKTNEVYYYNGIPFGYENNKRITNLYWTGKEYIYHDDYHGTYKKTTDFNNWEEINFKLNSESNGILRPIFYSNTKSFEYYNGRYIVRNKIFEESLYQIIELVSRFGKVETSPIYVLNDNFEIIGKSEFDNPVTAFSYVNGKFYIRTQDYVTNYTGENTDENMNTGQPINKIYVSEDAINWTVDETLREIPIYNGGRNIMSFDEGHYIKNNNADYYYEMMKKSVGNDLENMAEVKYEDKPLVKYGVIDGMYISHNSEDIEKFRVSLDGVYWFELAFPESEQYGKLIQYIDMGNKLLFQTKKNLIEYDIAEIKESILSKCPSQTAYIKLNNEILGFSQPPITENDRTLVPMRFLFEEMGAEVSWDEETGTAKATMPSNTTQQMTTFGAQQENSVTFSIDNTIATVNGQTTRMDVPARLINDKTMVPLRFLSENLGCTVSWDESTNTAIVTTE